MNKERRKVLQTIYSSLEGLMVALETVQVEEENYRDNMPENLQGSERYEESEESISNIEDAVNSVEEAISSIESAME